MTKHKIQNKSKAQIPNNKTLVLVFVIGILNLFCTLNFDICHFLLYAQEWREVKSEHFFVYFTQDDKFAEEVLNKAELYYKNIASDLGYPRYSEFWTWDKRVKIYIYPDHASFLKASGQPKWSHGMADYKNKQILSYLWSQGFLESLLPHEIAHLVFRDFVGFKSEIPLWLDEGVAQWAEEARRPQLKAKIKELFDKDNLLLLKDITQLNILFLKERQDLFILPTRTKDNKDGILFLSVNNMLDTYYLEAASLVGFLIEEYGSDSFAVFCRQLREGKSIEEALQFTYPTYIRNLKELEDRWRQYLQES